MLDKEAVHSVGFLEGLVCALLNNFALRDDCDHVSLLDCAQAMGNHQHSPILAHFV